MSYIIVMCVSQLACLMIISREQVNGRTLECICREQIIILLLRRTSVGLLSPDTPVAYGGSFEAVLIKDIAAINHYFYSGLREVVGRQVLVLPMSGRD